MQTPLKDEICSVLTFVTNNTGQTGNAQQSSNQLDLSEWEMVWVDEEWLGLAVHSSLKQKPPSSYP